MTTAPAATPKERTKTVYMILQEKPESQHLPGLLGSGESVDVTEFTQKTVWVPVLANVHANSADDAVRVYAETLKKDYESFNSRVVAIAESSWKPQKVTVEQTTVVKVGEPT